MTATELRRKILEQVSSIESEEILSEIYRIVKAESELEPIYSLTDEEKKAIDAGIKDIGEGKVFTSEQADSQVKKWLKK